MYLGMSSGSFTVCRPSAIREYIIKMVWKKIYEGVDEDGRDDLDAHSTYSLP